MKRWVSRTLALAFVAALVTSCTTTTITPQAAQKPVQSYRIVELAEVQLADNAWIGQAQHFRRGFIERLRELKAFDTVTDPADATLPEGSIAVSGQITEVDKGNRAVRWLIGFGAGRARVEGQFKITDANGTVLATFGNAKAYAGGYGFGFSRIVEGFLHI